MVDDPAAIIVGAGPAGLAVAAALRTRNAPFEILERHDTVASSWRGHYERLHLHTPKNHSALPFVAFPKSFPRYPSREQVIEYLEAYARRFELRPQFGIDVRRCTRDVGTVAAIRSGAIRVRPAIASFAADEVRFVDGTNGRFDAVILATGYETGLRALFADEPDALDGAGRPRASGREAVPGLYFCGFNLVPTGLLREIAIEAGRIGSQIAA